MDYCDYKIYLQTLKYPAVSFQPLIVKILFNQK